MELDFKALQPKEYLSKFLEHGVRPDGRRANEARPLTVNAGSVSTADGSALVRMGGTLVTCGVKAEFTDPPTETPDHGYLVCNVDLPPCCSPHISPGPPSPLAQALSQTLQDTLISCRCIDLKSLCIDKEKLSWVLYVDVVCLSDDGNVHDACILAATAALMNTSLPMVDVSSGAPEVSLKERSPLTLSCLPLAVSWGLFQSHILFDPTSEEETLCTGQLSFVVLAQMKMEQPNCELMGGMTKIGRPGLSSKQIKDLTQQTQKRGAVLLKLLYTALVRGT